MTDAFMDDDDDDGCVGNLRAVSLLGAGRRQPTAHSSLSSTSTMALSFIGFASGVCALRARADIALS